MKSNFKLISIISLIICFLLGNAPGMIIPLAQAAPPPAPASVTLTITGATTATATWDVTEAEWWYVKISTSSTFPGWGGGCNTGSTSCDFTDLTPGTTYYAYVSSVNPNDWSYDDPTRSDPAMTVFTGAGTELSPYQISNCDQLQKIVTSSDLYADADFELVADIDCSTVNGDGVFEPIAWEMIAYTGTFEGNSHTISNLNISYGGQGTGLFAYAYEATFQNLIFEGGSVTGLDEGGSQVGTLLGGAEGVSINNVTSNLTVNSTGAAGGLIGWIGVFFETPSAIATTITNAAFTGSVTSTGVNAGGLIGEIQADGTTTNISSTYVDASVSGTNNVGGLLGGYRPVAISTDLIVTETYTSGTVDGANNVAGLIGYAGAYNYDSSTFYTGVDITISDSYSVAEVSGASYVAGVLGENYGTNIAVTNFYFGGGVYASGVDVESVAGIIAGSSGDTAAETLTDLFVDARFNVNAFGTASNIAYLIGISENTDLNVPEAGYLTNAYVYIDGEAQFPCVNIDGEVITEVACASVVTDSTYFEAASYAAEDLPMSNWDFTAEGEWDAMLGSYPTLQAITADDPVFPFAGGLGTVENPYQISSCTHLQNMSIDLGANYILNADINCSETSDWNYNAVEERYYGFEPIGESGNEFMGQLDGQGYIINGLYIYWPGSDGAGLFGYTSGATIIDVGLLNYSLETDAVGAYNYFGGLVGSMSDGIIENCFVDGIIEPHGGSYVGMLVGGLLSGEVASITGSFSSGNIEGATGDTLGGLVGINQGTIEDSYSTTGFSNSMATYVGGLVGKNESSISNSYSADSDVAGISYVGGLVGADSFNCEGCGVFNSFTTSTVTDLGAGDHVGGFSGGGAIFSYGDDFLYEEQLLIGGNNYWSNNIEVGIGDSRPAGADAYFVEDPTPFMNNYTTPPLDQWDIITETPVWSIAAYNYPNLLLIAADDPLTSVYVDDDYNVEEGTCGEYICGLNAFDTVSAAIEAVDEGGAVFIAGGEYLVEDLEITKNGLHFSGPGYDADDPAILYSETAPVFTINANSVTLDGLVFLNATLEEDFSYQYMQPIVMVELSVGTTVTNCEFAGGYIGLVFNTSSSENIATGSYFHDNDWAGLVLLGTGDNTITGNRFYNNARGLTMGLTPEGTMALNIAGTDVSSNVFESNMVGIFYSASNQESAVTIGPDNEIFGNDDGFYVMGDAYNVLFNGNSIYNNINISSGLHVEGATTGLDATENWWGDASGPYAEVNPEGAGDTIYIDETSQFVYYRPFCMDADCIGLSTIEVTPDTLDALFYGGSILPVLDDEYSDDEDPGTVLVTELQVIEDVVISIPVGEGEGSTTVTVPAGTSITRHVDDSEEATFDAAFLDAADVALDALSGFDEGELVGAFQWGIPNIGLAFAPAIRIDMFVGLEYAGETLTLQRSLEADSGWTQEGLLWIDADDVRNGTCIVDAEGVCSFRTTLASYYGATYETSGGSPAGSGSHNWMQCQDGADNDGDGLIDMMDSGCSYESDNDESTPVVTPEPVVPDVTPISTWPGGFKAGDLVKTNEYTSVYMIGTDGKRHPFGDEGSFRSYYNDFSQVKLTTLDILRQYEMGAIVPYKEGSLIKLQTMSKVFLVQAPNVLRWIMSESVFNSLGYKFDMVKQISDAFWGAYTTGADIK